VPKKYVEKVGDEASRRRRSDRTLQIRLVHPGVELVVEAFDQYWRKTRASNARLQGNPRRSDAIGRAQAREIDIVYSIRGELAEELQRTPGLSLKSSIVGTQWSTFRSNGTEVAVA